MIIVTTICHFEITNNILYLSRRQKGISYRYCLSIPNSLNILRMGNKNTTFISIRIFSFYSLVVIYTSYHQQQLQSVKCPIQHLLIAIKTIKYRIEYRYLQSNRTPAYKILFKMVHLNTQVFL